MTYEHRRDSPPRCRLWPRFRGILVVLVAVGTGVASGPYRDRKKRMFAFSCGCFTFEMAKENLGATWEYKYRLEIAAQKLPHYDSPLCDIAENFREIPVEEAFQMGTGDACFDYWRRLRLKTGLPINTLEKNPDGSVIRNRLDRQNTICPF